MDFPPDFRPEIPCSEEDRSTSPLSPMEHDAEQPLQAPSLSVPGRSFLSRHLAALPHQTETLYTTEVGAGGPATEITPDPVGCELSVIRVFMNHGVLCYANSVSIGFTWATLKAAGLTACFWQDGSRLVEEISRASPFTTYPDTSLLLSISLA